MFVLILARLKYDTGVSDNFVRLSRLLFGADKCFQAAFPEKLVITKTFHLTRKGFFFFLRVCKYDTYSRSLLWI